MRRKGLLQPHALSSSTSASPVAAPAAAAETGRPGNPESSTGEPATASSLQGISGTRCGELTGEAHTLPLLLLAQQQLLLLLHSAQQHVLSIICCSD